MSKKTRRNRNQAPDTRGLDGGKGMNFTIFHKVCLQRTLGFRRHWSSQPKTRKENDILHDIAHKVTQTDQSPQLDFFFAILPDLDFCFRALAKMEGKAKTVDKIQVLLESVIQATATGLYNIAAQFNRGFGEVCIYGNVLHLSASLWESRIEEQTHVRHERNEMV